MIETSRIVFALALAAGCTTTEPEQVDFADLETGEPELLGPEIEESVDDCAGGVCCTSVEGTWYSGCTTGSRDTCTGYYLPCGGGGCYLGADGCFAEPPGYNECCSSPSGGLQTAPQTTVDGASYCCDTCRLDDGVWTCSGCGTDPACAGHVFTCLGEYTGGGSCTSGPAGDNCCK